MTRTRQQTVVSIGDTGPLLAHPSHLAVRGERVPIDESCQLWLPVSFDPATGAAKMLHLDQWNPWEKEGS